MQEELRSHNSMVACVPELPSPSEPTPMKAVPTRHILIRVPQALEALMPRESWMAAAASPQGRDLAANLVNHHWAAGVVLGSVALRARAVAGTETPASDGAGLLVEVAKEKQVEGPIAIEAGQPGAGGSSVKKLAATGEQQQPEQPPGIVVKPSASLIEGDLLLEGVPFATLDAGLGRRSAVHVVSQVIVTPSLQRQIGSFAGGKSSDGQHQAGASATTSAAGGRQVLTTQACLQAAAVAVLVRLVV